MWRRVDPASNLNVKNKSPRRRQEGLIVGGLGIGQEHTSNPVYAWLS